MQGFSLDNSVAVFCGGASVLVGVVCLLALVSLLSARTSDAGAERAAALMITLMALALSLGVFWTASAGAPAFVNFAAAMRAPVALFQIPASIAAVVVAILAWRFPKR